jgi:hypothetical protein
MGHARRPPREGTPCRGCTLLTIDGGTHDSPGLTPRHRLGCPFERNKESDVWEPQTR